MRALILQGHGGPEQVSIANLPDPQPGPGQVRVKVRAAALNHLDLWVRAGWPQLKLSFPHVLGSDMAGEIDAVGVGVSASWTGKRVVVAPGQSCGRCEHCLSGNENLCRHFHLLGEHVTGGQAQYICVPHTHVLELPEKMSFVDAAALPVTFQTAWHMLVGRAGLSPNSTVLVHAASSGVGSAAIQIAKLFGARVITTTSGDEKCERARKLGADDVIDRTLQDTYAEVRRLTAKRGVDVVFEHTGTATWDASLRSLTTGGTLVTCGATTGHDAKIDLRFLFARQVAIVGSTMGTRAELLEILKHVAAGRLRPVIDRVMPLERGKEAQAMLERGEHFGKLVLEP